MIDYEKLLIIILTLMRVHAYTTFYMIYYIITHSINISNFKHFGLQRDVDNNIVCLREMHFKHVLKIDFYSISSISSISETKNKFNTFLQFTLHINTPKYY